MGLGPHVPPTLRTRGGGSLGSDARPGNMLQMIGDCVATRRVLSLPLTAAADGQSLTSGIGFHSVCSRTRCREHAIARLSIAGHGIGGRSSQTGPQRKWLKRLIDYINRFRTSQQKSKTSCLVFCFKCPSVYTLNIEQTLFRFCGGVR
jgi:hypothetical protein